MATGLSPEYEYVQKKIFVPSRPQCTRFSTRNESCLTSNQSMVQQAQGVSGVRPMQPVAYVSLAEVLAARPGGITEAETWALLCQAVQALQDLFLSDGASGGRFVPAISPACLLLSARGRVALPLRPPAAGYAVSYAAPEYRPAHKHSDTDIEKMLVYSLGECLKRAAVPCHSATTRLSAELCAVLTAMGRQLACERASLMHLLDVISDYSKRREQLKPFSHIVMDLYRETIIYRNSKPILPDCASQTHFKQYMVQPCSDRNELLTRRVEHFDNSKTISAKWRNMNIEQHLDYPRMTRNIFTSLEHLNKLPPEQRPSIAQRPKSICTNEELLNDPPAKHIVERQRARRHNMKRNPVKRAASRLYHVEDELPRPGAQQRNCIGPEFVIRASLPSKQLVLDDTRLGNSKMLTVIMLNGIKLEVNCKPEITTAGQLFEKILRSEDIEENYFLGLSVLISGDFVFLPSDVKLSKIITTDNQSDTRCTLFVRIRFFLPSLRGIRSQQSRHLLYLQLRRSLLESQLPCSLDQLYDLGGLALQAEFGDYNEKHEANHYFLLEHYIPETLLEDCNTDEQIRRNLTSAHIQRRGLNIEKSEEDYILLAQSLPNYGVHFYSATLVSKNTNRDVWLCVSAQGINLFERSGTIIPIRNPPVYEIFKWQNIQTLCYSKHFLCILPHCTPARKSLPRKYKLKMDHKKSYYTFRLASLHHQFFLRLKTEYSSLQSLSQQFGVLLKDIKNEANSLFKLASHTSETKFQPMPTSYNHFENRTSKCKRSKSVHELNYSNIPLEEFQNKENEHPKERKEYNNDKPYVTSHAGQWDKRKGVKMGIRAFTSNGQRMSRSLEAVNAWTNEETEKMSLESSSRMSNSSSGVAQNADIYVLDSSIKSMDDQFLPNFHETLSQSLMEKLKNLSFADERILKTVTLHRDIHGSLGIQVTEGSDGKAYIQSVVPFGPASDTGNIFKGDQIVAVDGQNLLNLKYSDALQLLKKTDNKVELILSQISSSQSQCFQTPMKDSDFFASNNEIDRLKSPCERSVNYLSHELHNNLLKYDDKNENLRLSHLYQCSPYSNMQDHRTSCQRIYETGIERRMKLTPLAPTTICNFNDDDDENSPLLHGNLQTYPALVSPATSSAEAIRLSDVSNKCDTAYDAGQNPNSVSQVALPRSLGLGRRWRGPVRYPVTPIKNPLQISESGTHNLNASDEQIFI